MKKTILSFIIVLMLAVIPNTGSAALTTFEGSVQGFTCVTQGTICPVSKEDPLAEVERVFVLLTASNDYYFIPNVNRAALVNHINEKIRISGKKNPRYNSIEAWTIDAKGKGAWEKTWGAPTMEELARNPLLFW